MAFTLYHSIQDAYTKGNDVNLKAEIFLMVYRKNKLSLEYCKTSKKLIKMMKKTSKLQNNSEIRQTYQLEVEKLTEIKNDYVKQAIKENLKEINNSDLIASRLISRFGQGLRIVDTFKNLIDKDTPYGNFVRNVFISIDKVSLYKRIFKNEQSYLDNIYQLEPKLKTKEYINTEEGALKIESYFVIYLLEKSLKDFSEDQIKEMLQEISSELSKENNEMADQILDITKSMQLGINLSKILLQILRLSIGKGVFMNSSVIIANIILRNIMGKGMTYARNAVFRKYMASLLGGPWGWITAAILVIPDIAGIVNRRDFLAATNSIMYFYFLRMTSNVNF